MQRMLFFAHDIHFCPLLIKTKRTLRVFVYNTCANQQWQQEEEDALGTANVDDAARAEAEPSWTLRVEGRLVEVCASAVILFELALF